MERPHRDLLTYYVLSCLVFPPLFPVLATYLYFRYHTLRYKFTDEGISMSWGILFRREIIVNYARIQDIHLRANLIERWLGLARILVQTASVGVYRGDISGFARRADGQPDLSKAKRT